MKPSSDFFAQADSGSLKKKMSSARSADALAKAANADKNTISAAMRSIAAAELQKRGFPEWAINSVFLGETVCW